MNYSNKNRNNVCNSGNFIIYKFDGNDFSMWKFKIITELSSQRLDSYLTTLPNPHCKRELDEDLKALTYIKRCLSDMILRDYYDITSTKKLWEKLRHEYIQADAQFVMMKRNQFYEARKSVDETMIDFINRLKTVRCELNDASYEISDQDFVFVLIFGTYKEFGPFVSSIRAKKMDSEIKLNELCDQLIKEDNLRRIDKLNNARSQGKDKQVMHTNGNGHKRKRSLNSSFKNNNYSRPNSDKQNNDNKKDQYKSRPTHNRICYNCRKKGHYAKDCTSPKPITAQTKSPSHNP